MLQTQPLTGLLPENLPFDINLLPPKSYLVGGAVRDALLQRQREYLDLDFVLSEDAVETARLVAKRYQAGFVVLDEQRQIARVVFNQGTVDFALQEGESLEQDLRRRDFTINAIAFNPLTQEIIDPLYGLSDLEKGLLRMVSRGNLESDPLRLLRAYRQASQLQFRIEANTQATLRTLAPLLKMVAAERVQTELNYLLSNQQGTLWLVAAGKDGVVQPWLETVTAQRLEQLEQVDFAAGFFPELVREDSPRLAKLACLVSSKPKVAESQLLELKYPRLEVRTVVTAIKSLPGLMTTKTLREQYFFFLEAKSAFPTLALFAIAIGVNRTIIDPFIHRYLNPNDQVAHPTPLVTGNELMDSLSLPPSPLIGALLTEIQVARIDGKVRTRESAIAFADKLVKD